MIDFSGSDVRTLSVLAFKLVFESNSGDEEVSEQPVERLGVSAPQEYAILFILNAVRDLCGLATDQIAQTALSSRLQVIY